MWFIYCVELEVREIPFFEWVVGHSKTLQHFTLLLQILFYQ